MCKPSKSRSPSNVDLIFDFIKQNRGDLESVLANILLRDERGSTGILCGSFIQ